MTHDYPPPLDRLVSLGVPEFGHRAWMDYPSRFGVGQEHVPELIRMLHDARLVEGESSSYAAIHAWRALGQLGAPAAIPALLEVIQVADPHNDWVVEDLATVFERIGPAAFAPLVALFRDRSRPDHVRSRAASGFTDVAKAAPELRGDAVRVLTQALDAYAPESPKLHVYLVSNLLQLQAVESLPSIRRAFDEDRVNTRLMDWEEVQVGFGFLERRRTPLISFRPTPPPGESTEAWEDWPLPAEDPWGPPAASAAGSAKDRQRARARKKQAEKSRKQNRRKHR